MDQDKIEVHDTHTHKQKNNKANVQPSVDLNKGLCSSRKCPYPPQGRALKILRGRRVSKVKIVKKCMKLNWKFQGDVGGFKSKNLPLGVGFSGTKLYYCKSSNKCPPPHPKFEISALGTYNFEDLRYMANKVMNSCGKITGSLDKSFVLIWQYNTILCNFNSTSIVLS